MQRCVQFFWHLTFLLVVSSAIIYYQIVVNLENTPPRNTYSHINLNATFPLCNPLVSFITRVVGKLFYCSIMIDIKSLHIKISQTFTNFLPYRYILLRIFAAFESFCTISTLYQYIYCLYFCLLYYRHIIESN